LRAVKVELGITVWAKDGIIESSPSVIEANIKTIVAFIGRAVGSQNKCLLTRSEDRACCDDGDKQSKGEEEIELHDGDDISSSSIQPVRSSIDWKMRISQLACSLGYEDINDTWNVTQLCSGRRGVVKLD
jgi:hypothetical protein